MQRTRILYLIGSLLVIPQAATAEPQAAPPSVNVPAPVEAKREPVPSPAATPPAAPAPEQKAAAPGAKDKKGADKKAADKKEKKPKVLARDLFGKTQTAAALAPRSLGWYAKGCLSGGVHLADTGPDWQTMRLSRNRAWGHPKLIKLLKRLASEAKARRLDGATRRRHLAAARRSDADRPRQPSGRPRRRHLADADA